MLTEENLPEEKIQTVNKIPVVHTTRKAGFLGQEYWAPPKNDHDKEIRFIKKIGEEKTKAITVPGQKDFKFNIDTDSLYVIFAMVIGYDKWWSMIADRGSIWVEDNFFF